MISLPDLISNTSELKVRLTHVLYIQLFTTQWRKANFLSAGGLLDVPSQKMGSTMAGAKVKPVFDDFVSKLLPVHIIQLGRLPLCALYTIASVTIHV